MLLKKLDNVTAIDTSNLAFKSDYIDLKVEVGKPDIDKLINVSTSLNNVFKKVNDLCVDKLRLLLSVDLKSKN